MSIFFQLTAVTHTILWRLFAAFFSLLFRGKKENLPCLITGCLLFSIRPWRCDFSLFSYLSFFGTLGRHHSVDDGFCRGAPRMLPRTDQTGCWFYASAKGMYIDTGIFHLRYFCVMQFFQQTGAGSLFLSAQGGFGDIVSLLIRDGAPVNARCKVNSLQKVSDTKIS